jgi:hypothetical protein
MSNPGDRYDYRLLPDHYKTEYDRDNERESIENWFLDAVAANTDLPIKCAGSTDFPISAYLGECMREEQPLLFKACHLALHNDHNATAAALRKFVEQVARHHATEEIPQ